MGYGICKFCGHVGKLEVECFEVKEIVMGGSITEIACTVCIEKSNEAVEAYKEKMLEEQRMEGKQ